MTPGEETDRVEASHGPSSIDPAEFIAFLREKAAEPHWHSKGVHDAINARMGWHLPYRPATLADKIKRLKSEHEDADILREFFALLTQEQRERQITVDYLGEYGFVKVDIGYVLKLSADALEKP